MSLLRRILVLLLLSGMPGLSRSLPAQSPQDRVALQRFRDSLATVKDTTALMGLETRMIAVAKTQRDDALIHTRLGFLALRLRELGSRKHLDYAASEFEWAIELQPAWPWPYLGMGLIDKLMPGAGRYAGGLFTLLGLDAESKAGKDFAASLKVDSSFTEGLMEFSDIALNQRINAPVEAALDALRNATAKTPSPELLMARGRLERLAGHPDSAVRMFGLTKAITGPTDMLWLEIARTVPLVAPSIQQWAQVPGGDSAYFFGAGSTDTAVVAMYRMDLAPIADDTSLTQFDALSGEARVTWLRQFWLTKDQLDLRPSGSRLSEHFHRWDLARRKYRLTPYRRRYARGQETYKSGNRDVDDRGIVLLRHGEPTTRVVWPISPRGPGDTLARDVERTTLDADIKLGQSFLTQPAVKGNYGNESWVFIRPDGDFALHFAANFDPDDYRLQASVLGLDVSFYEMLGTINAGTYIPGVRALLEASGSTVDFRWTEERMRGRKDIATATTTDSWFREYAHKLPGRPGWFAAGIRDGKPLIHLVYAVDSKALSEEPWNRIPVTFRAVFLDANGKIVATLDTLEMVARPLKTTTIVAVHAEVALPPNAQRVRLGVEVTPDRGIVYKTDTLTLPQVDGRALALSDILAGREDISLVWNATPRDSAFLDPLISYSPSDTLQVYAEAYGVKAGEAYQVKLVLTRQQGGVSRLLGGRRAAVTLSESVTFTETIGRIRRSLPLRTVEPGDYSLEITVEGKNGKVTSQRRVYIAK